MPSPNLALTATQNKNQLTEIFCKSLLQDTDIHQSQDKLVVTGQEQTPVETGMGNFRARTDLSKNHEEADNIIVQQTVLSR